MRKITLAVGFFVSLQMIVAQSDQSWKADDIIKTEYLGSPVVSPDNNKVIWSKAIANKKKDRFVRHLFLSRLDVMKNKMPLTVQLTRGDESCRNPLFSRDSEMVYFLSGREEGKKLWSMSLYGGEPESVHEFEHGISSLRWQNDSTILFLSNDGPSLLKQELKEKKDNVIVVEDTTLWTRTRLYSFDLKGKTVGRLTHDPFPVSSYAISHNGQWLIYTLQMSTHYASDANPDNRVMLVNLDDGRKTQILADQQEPGGFQFTGADDGFYYRAIRSSDPEWNGAGEPEVWFFNLANNTKRQIDLDWKWGASYSMFVHDDDVLVGLANGPLTRWADFRQAGNTWQKRDFQTGAHAQHFYPLTISEDFSKIVFEHSTGNQLPRYYIADRQSNGLSNAVELVTLNKKLHDKPKVKHEVLRWTGWNDEEVNGILYYPKDYVAGKSYPLMLSIHGGPAGVDQDRWRERWSTYPQLIAQRGAFVLKPNYHGSSNHGQAFVESIKGNYYNPELADITSGIEHLIEKGMVDRNELGVMGWSNGAILATMLTVRYPDMFKVACPGAGDVNWTSDYGTCRFGVSFDQSYFGGAPWDDINGKIYNENYILLSPLFELEKVKTPTIIFHGSSDRAVPRDQGWEYYRALQQAGQTAVRFLWFPDQPHGLQKITHIERKMKEELTWIDRYLFDKSEEEPTGLKKDSPLALVLEQQAEMGQGNFFGSLADDLLVPQVTKVSGSTMVGKYEVTNAQFSEFDDNHTVAPGTGNLPARVSHQQAIAYCKWLSDKTGDKYRLPTTDEAAKWHKKAKTAAPKENTLTYWAGYEISFDDAAKLKKQVDKVHDRLIKPVGQFNSISVGEGKLHDLGGNVREYAVDGSTYGFSAIDLADGNADPDPADGFTGFRVVREISN